SGLVLWPPGHKLLLNLMSVVTKLSVVHSSRARSEAQGATSGFSPLSTTFRKTTNYPANGMRRGDKKGGLRLFCSFGFIYVRISFVIPLRISV
ncbi:hypothetical protein ACO0E6_003778, partial [Cronobacter sakazakii]